MSRICLPNHGMRRRRRRWVSRSHRVKRQTALAPSTPHGIRNLFSLRPCMTALLTWFVQSTAAVPVVGPSFDGIAPGYAPVEDAPEQAVGGEGSSGGHMWIWIWYLCGVTHKSTTPVTHPKEKKRNALALGQRWAFKGRSWKCKLYSEKTRNRIWKTGTKVGCRQATCAAFKKCGGRVLWVARRPSVFYRCVFFFWLNFVQSVNFVSNKYVVAKN